MSEYPIEHLSDEDAWNLVQANQIGRIASARQGAPDIYPVSYLVHNWKIYFRTGIESRLRKDIEGNLVAFEAAQQMDRDFSSTVILGMVRVLAEAEASRMLDQLPIVEFAPESDYIWMEIDPSEVRGRKLTIL
jgi:nitroimidazol reductase NimA-like FMN-containing flavoprotein (pyridoxamine 5'-phosphate oxidase superfamily)